MDRSEYTANLLIAETPQLRYIAVRPAAAVRYNNNSRKKTLWDRLCSFFNNSKG